MATGAEAFAQLQMRRQLGLVRRQRPRVRRLPPARAPRAVALGYLRELRLIVAELNQAVLDVLLPALPALVRAQVAGLPGVRQDAPADDIQRQIALLELAFNRIVSENRLRVVAMTTAERTAQFNRQEFGKQVKAGLGTDPLGAEPALANQAAAFTRENVKLIKSIATDQLADVEGIVLRGARRGRRVEEISAEIRGRFGVSESRAKLIARDQVSKFNGELAQSRQQSVGVTRYIWRTSQDERVRESHAALDGTIQEWASPPVVDEKTGRTAHPGEDFQCRCTAEPILDDVLAQVEGREPAIPAGATTNP